MVADATLILMPGLHGTDELFDPFTSVIPPLFRRRIISYPAIEAMSYDALLKWLELQLESERTMVLIAESFSGPLAIRYAAAHPTRVSAVVLVATFIKPPLPRWLRYFVHPLIFRLPPPDFALRFVLLGKSLSESSTRQVKSVIRRVPTEVLAERIRQVFEVDCDDALKRCGAPILYLAAAKDKLIRKKSIKEILQVHPDVRVIRLPGPHLLLQANPIESWRAIDSFLPAPRPATNES